MRYTLDEIRMLKDYVEDVGSIMSALGALMSAWEVNMTDDLQSAFDLMKTDKTDYWPRVTVMLRKVLLEVPLEDLPLYTTLTGSVGAAVKWRLTIGK